MRKNSKWQWRMRDFNSDKDEEQKAERPSRDNRGDFMVDDRPRVKKKNRKGSTSEEDEDLQDFEKAELGNRKRRDDVATKKTSKQESSGEYESEEDEKDEKPRSKPEQKVIAQKRPVARGREGNNREELNEKREDPITFQNRNHPASRKRRDSPEVIEDNSIDSDEGQEPKDHFKTEKEKGLSNIMILFDWNIEQPREDKKGRVVRDEVDDFNYDVDRIVKNGIKETIKLDPPSPRKEELENPNDPPPYFTGFMSNRRNVAPNKDCKKPIIKVKNIIKKPKAEGDLLSDWEKKYGKQKQEMKRDEWGNEAQSQLIKKSEPLQVEKPTNNKKYVQNVLANQATANGEDFEDNWDEEDGSPHKSGVEYDKNYRHPDIPEESGVKAKKKKGKKKVHKSKIEHNTEAKPDEDFDLNWDE